MFTVSRYVICELKRICLRLVDMLYVSLNVYIRLRLVDKLYVSLDIHLSSHITYVTLICHHQDKVPWYIQYVHDIVPR